MKILQEYSASTVIFVKFIISVHYAFLTCVICAINTLYYIPYKN